jgi:pyrimidine-nucleoside phosphorylase
MKDLTEAQKLAELMVDIAEGSGRKAVALLSDMNQPLGRAVGNALEVREAIDTLHNQGPEDFVEHCLVVAAHMLALGGDVKSAEEGRSKAEKSLNNGGAWEKFKSLIANQGGDVAYLEDPDRLPTAAFIEKIGSPRAGYLSQVDALTVGETAVDLGAGRAKKTDSIDHAVGIEVLHKVGDYVEKDQPVFIVHASDEASLAAAGMRLLNSLGWSDDPVEQLPLFYGVVGD